MNVPTQIVNDIASSTAAVFSGSLPLIIILFGLGISLYIVRTLVGLIPKSK
jgi:hypothetical protein